MLRDFDYKKEQEERVTNMEKVAKRQIRYVIHYTKAHTVLSNVIVKSTECIC